MAKQKSEQRKAAESISRQTGISVKSAMRRLQRAALGESKNPTKGVKSKSVKRKVSKAVEKRKEKIIINPGDFFNSPDDYKEFQRRINKGGNVPLLVYGEYSIFNSADVDVRDRTVQFNLSNKQARKLNKFLQAGDYSGAGKYLIEKVEQFGGESDSKLEIYDIEVF